MHGCIPSVVRVAAAAAGTARRRALFFYPAIFYGTGLLRTYFCYKTHLLRGIEIDGCFYLSPANRSRSGSSEGTREWIRE